jgi:subtilisin family serine protease/N-acetylneuraminic acid mutarotase
MTKIRKKMAIILVAILLLHSMELTMGLASVETNDILAPTVPINLRYSIINKNILLTWEEAADNIAVKGYIVYRDGKEIGSCNDLFYTDDLDYSSKSYNYYIKAVDASGNLSADSNHIYINLISEDGNLNDENHDNENQNEENQNEENLNEENQNEENQGNENQDDEGQDDDSTTLYNPSIPANLSYTRLTDNSILLTWQVTSAEVIIGYDIYRDDVKIGSSVEPYFTDSDLSLETDYTYKIVALDLLGNTLQHSEPLVVNLLNDKTINSEEDTSDLADLYEYKTNRFIVKYKNGKGSMNLKKHLKENLKGSQIMEKYGNDDYVNDGNGNKNIENNEIVMEVITLDKRVKPDDFVNEVKNKKKNTNTSFDFSNDIDYIQPDYELTISSIDPFYDQQWGVLNTESKDEQQDKDTKHDEIAGIDSSIEYIDNPAVDILVNAEESNNENDSDEKGTYRVDANVPMAWEQSKGEGVTIAIIDTGIDLSHEDLRDNIWTNNTEIPDNFIDDDGNGYIDDVNGWNFVNRSNQIHNPLYINDEWHGTHIAGIIAAQEDNSLGITGVAPDANIMPLKVFENGIAYTSDIIAAIEYAERMGARIVNCSWGTTEDNPALKEAISNSNMLFVCAAGNNHVNVDIVPVYPAAYSNDNIISVASVNSSGILSNFSNYGENSVDVSAPGEEILSTRPDNSYLTSSGTSMAAAFVSGEAALILSLNKELDANAIKGRILSSSDKLSSLSGKIFNSNKINCYNAILNVSTDEIIQINVIDNNNYSSNSNLEQSGYNLYSSGTWESRADFPNHDYYLKAVTLNGKIYVMGGFYSPNTVYEYDPLTNIWSQKSSMQVKRYDHVVAAVNGKIYAIGGYTENSVRTNTIEEFNPTTGAWTLKTNMPTARAGASAAVVNNIIYVMGGTTGYATNVVEAYSPATNTWTTKANMLTARRYANATTINNKIYIVGGGALSSMEMYDPSTNSWTLKASMSIARYGLGVEAVNGNLYAMGGYSSSSLVDSIEIYSPLTNSWSTGTSMPRAKSHFGSAVYNNMIYTIAGFSNSIYWNSVHCFKPIDSAEYVYDINNRLIEIKRAGVVIIKLKYDKNGNLINVNYLP